MVVAVLTLIASSAYPLGSGFLARNTFENKVEELVNSLRIAQLNTLAGKESNSWGVNVSQDAITLFKGSSYSSRDPSYDEVFEIPGGVSVSPIPAEVVFDRLNGNPGSSIAFSLNNDHGQVSNVSVNELGIVDVD